MSDSAAEGIANPPRGFPPQIKRRVALTFAPVKLGTCAVAAALYRALSSGQPHRAASLLEESLRIVTERHSGKIIPLRLTLLTG